MQPGVLRAILDRRIDTIEPQRVRGCLPFFVSTKVGRLRRRRGERRASHWARQNGAFGRAVCALSWGAANTVYAYNGAALEIFERARRKGMRCILDQTAAPWRFNSMLLEEELRKWSGWEEEPADIDRDGHMIAREEAEWTLADRIICGSGFVVDAMRTVGGPVHKCAVVPYPVPEGVLKTSQRETARPRPLRVLFVGTLQLRKGIQYVWEAAGQQKDTGYEVRAIGPSNLTPSAERLVQQRMDWQHNVSRSDVWKHYYWADVLLLPTLSEGSANVCWEALACGTRVATTQAAGLEAGKVDLIEPNPSAIESYLRTSQVRHGMPSDSTHLRRSAGEYGADLVRAMSCD